MLSMHILTYTYWKVLSKKIIDILKPSSSETIIAMWLQVCMTKPNYNKPDPLLGY